MGTGDRSCGRPSSAGHAGVLGSGPCVWAAGCTSPRGLKRRFWLPKAIVGPDCSRSQRVHVALRRGARGRNVSQQRVTLDFCRGSRPFMGNHLPVGSLGWQWQLRISIHYALLPGSLPETSPWKLPSVAGMPRFWWCLSFFRREVRNTLCQQQVCFFSRRKFWSIFFGKLYHLPSSQCKATSSHFLPGRSFPEDVA